MVHLGNKAILFLLCSCFFINSQNITQTSILFLLCAFIIGCLFSYWEGSKGGILFLTALVCLLMLCFPAFGFYLPVFIYDIIQAKDYFLLIPAGIGLIRFCPAFLSCCQQFYRMLLAEFRITKKNCTIFWIPAKSMPL